VARAQKTIERMRNNPRGWRIQELKSVAVRNGIEVDQDGTSHVVFRHRVAGRLTVPADRPVKPVYVRLFLDYLARLEGTP
jgi:predicted RNA binding protein YcfA (HicA-like mRNA interferase family)